MRLALSGALLLLCALDAGTAVADAPAPADSFATDAGGLGPAQETRYQKLTHELRCLVCQNETIGDSQAALAGDMRDQVRSQIVSGRSDAQIIKYLTDRYGDFVLYKPPFKPLTLLLWLGPALLALLALLVALLHLRRSRRPSARLPVDAAALKHLLEEDRQ